MLDKWFPLNEATTEGDADGARTQRSRPRGAPPLAARRADTHEQVDEAHAPFVYGLVVHVCMIDEAHCCVCCVCLRCHCLTKLAGLAGATGASAAPPARPLRSSQSPGGYIKGFPCTLTYVIVR